MTPHAVLGMDAAQAGVAYHLQTLDDERVLATGRVPATLAGWKELSAVLDKHQLRWPCVFIGIEATGQWHLPWCEAASAAGATVFALNPLLAKRTSSAANAIRDAKSDPIDAAGLVATLARSHRALTRFIYRSQPQRFSLRKLLSVRESVRASLTNLKKSAGDLQALLFPELAALKLPEGARHTLLTHAPSAVEIAAPPLALYVPSWLRALPNCAASLTSRPC